MDRDRTRERGIRDMDREALLFTNSVGKRRR